MWDVPVFPLVTAITIVAAPLLLVCWLGLHALCERPLSETRTGRAVFIANCAGLMASLMLLGWMLASGSRHVAIGTGHWAEIPHYHFAFKFLFDRLSIPFAIMTFVLCGTIGAFSHRYLHREPGFNRFFILYSVFMLGMILATVAGTIETLFFGWEMVGLSSCLLVAFFHERTSPVANGLWIWTVYRISDAALLAAHVLLHHLSGGGDFDLVSTNGYWPDGVTVLTPNQAFTVGLLFVIAAAGKSALVPFSGWLPRAMEGPTSSSAVFYGALSVHLGAFLLLRISPLISASTALSVIVVTLGLLTALYASICGRVQTDIKSALAFASVTQVGIIVAEIGFGFRYLALAHIIGHTCLRTLQFLRAPALLQDYHLMENAIGSRLPRLSAVSGWLIPARVTRRCYRLALDRGSLDVLLRDFAVRPVLKLLQACDRLERRWMEFVSGAHTSRHEHRREPVAHGSRSLEDLA